MRYTPAILTVHPSLPMGMFDYLRCDYPLPVPAVQGEEFQTKSFKNPSMDTYVIRADGTLAHVDYDIEDHSNPTLGGMAQFWGSMTRVNLREVASDYSGKVRFGTPYGQPVKHRQGGGYVRFEAHFQHGKLVRLDIESHVEPPEVVAARQEHEALDGALPAGANSTKPARL